jgi:2,3-bisphosphoglycerate-dependent phosphoglycerate mutase
MRLYFIRHGQSENNALYNRTGSDTGRVDDPRLTEIGLRQATLTGKYLAMCSDPVEEHGDEKEFGITHVYSSPMFRAIATGRAIADQLHLSLGLLKDWHENGGIYLQNVPEGEQSIRSGLTRAEMMSHFPGIAPGEFVRPNGWWNREYESADERPVRARRALRELLDRHGKTDDRVVMVSHGGFYNEMIAAVMTIEPVKAVWFRLFNCAISRFDFVEDERLCVYLNYVSHLPGNLTS